MKWLLITTAQRAPERLDTNPGDQFVRIGIEKLIRAVDPDAEFDYLDKEDPDNYRRERSFDKTVMCGMPCIWSLPGNECQDIHWWNPILRGWPTARKKDFLIAGAGEVHVDRINDPLKWADALQELLDRSYAFTARQPIKCHPQIIESVCPSAFTMLGVPRTGDYSVCNFMPEGGHFGYASSNPCNEIWPEVFRIFQAAGWKCVAHTQTEREYAHSLGWSDVAFFDSDQAYLDFYAAAAAYFGNRAHGAAVVAAHGGDAWLVTHDSRRGMVDRLGGRTDTPSELSLEKVRLFAHGCRGAEMDQIGLFMDFCVKKEWDRMTDLFREFVRE